MMLCMFGSPKSALFPDRHNCISRTSDPIMNHNRHDSSGDRAGEISPLTGVSNASIRDQQQLPPVYSQDTVTFDGCSIKD